MRYSLAAALFALSILLLGCPPGPSRTMVAEPGSPHRHIIVDAEP